MKRLFEVEIATYTQVWAENEDQAIAYAKELLGTTEDENVSAAGDLAAFSFDDVSVIEDLEAA